MPQCHFQVSSSKQSISILGDKINSPPNDDFDFPCSSNVVRTLIWIRSMRVLYTQFSNIMKIIKDTLSQWKRKIQTWCDSSGKSPWQTVVFLFLHSLPASGFVKNKLSGEEDSRLNDLLWLLGRFPYPEDMGRRHRILSFLSTYFPSPVPPLDSIYVIQLLNQYHLYLKEFLKSDTCLSG